jgi:hypothetical protein
MVRAAVPMRRLALHGYPFVARLDAGSSVEGCRALFLGGHLAGTK